MRERTAVNNVKEGNDCDPVGVGDNCCVDENDHVFFNGKVR